MNYYTVSEEWLCQRSLADSESQSSIVYFRDKEQEEEDLANLSISSLHKVSACHYEIIDSTLKYNVFLPKQQLDSFITNAASFDVLQQLILAGSTGGTLSLYSVKSHERLCQIEAEKTGFDITHCRIFPSAKAALTVASNWQIRIWDLVQQQCARTFVGHKGRITAVSLIGKGRNFVTCSLDGCLKLWECGSGQCVKTFRRVTRTAGMSCLEVCEPKEAQAIQASDELHPLEFGTKGVIIYTGHENGIITQWDLYKGGQARSFRAGPLAITSLLSWDCYLVAGTVGKICVLNEKGETIKELQINSPCSVGKLGRIGDELVVHCKDIVMSFCFMKWVNEGDLKIVNYYGEFGEFVEIKEEKIFGMGRMINVF